jgi:hypothetical protein
VAEAARNEALDGLQHQQRRQRDTGRDEGQVILPPPAATPTAAFTHTVAAVVRPWMPLSVRMIAPAPRNPMPVTICAAMRPGSPNGPDISIDITVNSAAPTAMRMLVRSPASFCRISRSKPSAAPSSAQ